MIKKQYLNYNKNTYNYTVSGKYLCKHKFNISLSSNYTREQAKIIYHKMVIKKCPLCELNLK